MDAIDRKILDALQRDGRLTNQALSEEVGLSPSPCLRRVRVLERNGVIRGYRANLSASKCGLDLTAFIRVRLRDHAKDDVRAFEGAVRDLPEVLDCFLVSGDADYVLRVVARDLADYERFVRHGLQRLPNLASIDSSIAYGTVKRGAPLPLPLSYQR